jgi:Putative endonuclease segE, GIY-YIG domain
MIFQSNQALHTPINALLHKYCMTTPFSYHLFHKPTQKHYYGIKFSKGCSPAMLWTTYFSSSLKVKELIALHGADSFEVEVRKIFKTGHQALLWEHRVLSKLDAAGRDDWLNRHNGGKKFRSPECHSDKTKETLRAKITGKKRSATTKAKQAAAATKREQERRAQNWTMPTEAKERALDTRKKRIADGTINPYSAERNAKMGASKAGTKRHYLPDGSFVMRKI